MKLIALLLFTVAAPAAAQDWARVFDTVPEGEPRHELLVLDPEIDRADRARYRRLPLGSAGLAAWAGAQRSGHLLRLTPFSPTWNLLLFTGPSIQPFIDPSTAVVASFQGEQDAVMLPSGAPLRWGNLETGALHVLVRGPAGLVLMR